jgi:hypothetical protein
METRPGQPLVASAHFRIPTGGPPAPFASLTSVPGWGVVRAASYGAALGDPGRWPSLRQVYRAADCPRPSTNRPAGAATGRSAAKAA